MREEGNADCRCVSFERGGFHFSIVHRERIPSKPRLAVAYL